MLEVITKYLHKKVFGELVESINYLINQDKENKKLIEALARANDQERNMIERQSENGDYQKGLLEQVEKKLNALEIEQKENQEVQTRLIKVVNDIRDDVVKIQEDAHAGRIHAWQSQLTAQEILWGQVFHDVISGSNWLVDKSFAAGRWAVGYQYLYVVYRILDEIQPKKILELGLGQSTKLIGQYAAYQNGKVSHKIVEHDTEWINFFGQKGSLSDESEIIQLPHKYKAFHEDGKVLTFENFKEAFSGQKFDFISIDAPFGGEAVIYARIDILEILPECLERSFIIIIDDFNRQGEKNMVNVLEEILTTHGIAYEKGVYRGNKESIVICSKDLKFVCTM